MNINWNTALTGLEGVLKIVEEVAPAGAVLGPEGAAIGALVSKASGFAEQLLSLAESATTTLSSNDLATIRAATATLQAKNNMLAAGYSDK